MPLPEAPPLISVAEERRRLRRVNRIARDLGFVGQVRHVLSRTGGAQYGKGANPDEDLLVVYAEAFDRDADPNEYSLEAIIAHERGHQLLHRHPRLRAFLNRWDGNASEEMMASVIGSLVASGETNKEDLLVKAVGEAIRWGVEPEDAVWLASELRVKLEETL